MNDLPYRRLVLKNGLVVLLHQDSRLPLVAVDLTYRVGSKDEPLGLSGFAHLFEHLMFMGTERVDGAEFDRLMEAVGGSSNASTSNDHTSYTSSGPSEILPLLLWLEADRMEGVGRAMTEEKLNLQRDVVLNERRQSYENVPYGQSWLELSKMLYPASHPYHVPVIGSVDDIAAATVDDVKRFFETFYVPVNASLAIAGDFELDATEALIQDLFADLPSGSPPVRRAAPRQRRPQILGRTLEDDVPAERMILAWHSPSWYAPGDAAMDLAASILAEGAASRLEVALVKERRLAQSVSAEQESGLLGSEFVISATVLPGVPLATLEQALHEELRRFRTEGPTMDELERVKSANEAWFSRTLQGLADRAEAMILYEEVLGDPGAVSQDLERYRRLTPASIRKTCHRFLAPSVAACLKVIPKSKDVKKVTARDHRPEIGSRKPFVVTSPVVCDDPRIWLTNSIAEVPLVALDLAIPGGLSFDEPGLEGGASLCAELMFEGTADLENAAALSTELDRLGATMDVSPQVGHLSFSLTAIDRNLLATLDVLEAVLRTPRLRSEDFERLRALRLAALERRRSDAQSIAAVVAQRWLHDHRGPRAHPVSGYPAGIERLTLSHMEGLAVRFKDALCSASAVLAGGGDAAVARVHQLLGPRSLLASPVPSRPIEGLSVVVVHKEDAPQTVIRFLRPVVSLTHPSSPSLWIASTALGGTFTSRLNANLRETHGYTYGINANLRQDATSGTLTVATSVDTEVTLPALRELLAELSRAATGDFDDAEILAARASERAWIVADFETVAGVASQHDIFARYGLPADSLAKSLAALESQSAQSINEAARENLGYDRGVLVLVGDITAFGDALESLGLPPHQAANEDGEPLEGGV